MYNNKQVCLNPQQMAKNWETIIFLLNNPSLNTNFESSFDFNIWKF